MLSEKFIECCENCINSKDNDYDPENRNCKFCDDYIRFDPKVLYEESKK